MPNAVIQVQNIYQADPGKKTGKVRDVTGADYRVKPADLAVMREGATYDVFFEDNNFNGQTYHMVKSVKAVGGGAAPAQNFVPAKSNGNASSYYKETSARDAERMFVCSILNAGIQAGKVQFDSTHIKATVVGLRGVWQETFGTDEHS
jgi:hypothetical protein